MAESVEETGEAGALRAGRLLRQELLPALQRLDRLLERAVTAAQVAYGPEATADPYRGLYISQSQVEELLAREPGLSLLQAAPGDPQECLPDSLAAVRRLEWLVDAFSLTPFDLDLMLIALAPELDLRYERLYAYLQDDVTRRRPSVDLALNLLCTSAEARLARRAHFATSAPLIRHGLLHLLPDPNQAQPPLLAHFLKLDEQIVRLLIGPEGLDPRLASFCHWVVPSASLDELPVIGEVKQALPALVNEARETGSPMWLYFRGPRGAGKRRAAEALAGEVGIPLLVVDLELALAANGDFRQSVRLLAREARFQSALLYLDGLDALRGGERSVSYQLLLETLAEERGIAILAGAQPWLPTGVGPAGVLTVPFPIPDLDGRTACWQAHLSAAGIELERGDLDALAGRFRLTPGQIADAVATARSQARWRAAGRIHEELPWLSDQLPTVGELFAAARAESGHDLAALAHKIEPVHTWGDLILPDDAQSQLLEICQQVAERHRVLDEWGFGRKQSLGRGVNALFAGPSGTGKTTAAEIIASRLGLDMYKIDLSGVVSKYIGETEKNLERIFSAAENANAILFFDEADALFGKRSEVRDSHDRYANIEIAYLLQRMEQYDGVAILATNLRQNIDEAFTRRLQFIVEFPFPDEEQRQGIWRLLFPGDAPCEEGIDYGFLAQQLRITGGNIKNIVMRAAFLAASAGGPIGMQHLVQATRREYQKMGRLLSDADLGPYAGREAAG
jgi:AAA+ superfamily predicted ATPase